MSINSNNFSSFDNYQRLEQISDYMRNNMRLMLEQSANEKDRELEKEFYRELMDQYAILLEMLKEKIEEVTRLSITDPLTKVFNRGKITAELERELERAQRYNSKFSVVMFDIDFFKHVNDTYGHDIGDEVLIEFSRRIVGDIRKTDIFGRWGGEEFLMILPETAGKKAQDLAERFRTVIESSPFNDVGTVTCSVGVSSNKENDTLNTLLKRADNGLYKAKEGGRNCVRFVE